MAAQANIKSMSIDKLVQLRDQIDSTLSSKVTEERRTLEAQLSQLSRFGGGGSRSAGMRAGSRGKVAPKYRNPDNPSETWAGRGLKPRWLTAAIVAGKKLEHFSIATSANKGPTKRSRKTGKK